MNCIIIDDEELSRMVLEKYIRQAGFLNLVHSFKSAIEAINYLKDNKNIDLVFLDIEMPEMTGIEFLQSFNNLPQIIITSGKQKYAIDAFEYDVVDYLLKPISYPRLFKAVDKAYTRYKEINRSKESNDGFFIKTSNTLVRIKYEDILWVEALENYVGINTFENKFTIHFTMKAIETELPPSKFTRVHRSFIVNTSKIGVIEENTIIIKISKGNKIIPIGKSYKDKLMDDINLVVK